jgi:hypothetical protein
LTFKNAHPVIRETSGILGSDGKNFPPRFRRTCWNAHALIIRPGERKKKQDARGVEGINRSLFETSVLFCNKKCRLSLIESEANLQKRGENGHCPETELLARTLLLLHPTPQTFTTRQAGGAMNPTTPNNPLDATRGRVACSPETEFDVTYSDAAFCDFSEWIDQELITLEAHFVNFVTKRSQKRSHGR